MDLMSALSSSNSVFVSSATMNTHPLFVKNPIRSRSLKYISVLFREYRCFADGMESEARIEIIRELYFH